MEENRKIGTYVSTEHLLPYHAVYWYFLHRKLEHLQDEAVQSALTVSDKQKVKRSLHDGDILN